MNDNDDLPSAGMDPFASPVIQTRPRSPSSRWLITAGGLFFLFGCVIGFGATVIQSDAQENWEGFYAFLALCPVPCIALGIILLIAGALPLWRKYQFEDA